MPVDAEFVPNRPMKPTFSDGGFVCPRRRSRAKEPGGGLVGARAFGSTTKTGVPVSRERLPSLLAVTPKFTRDGLAWSRVVQPRVGLLARPEMEVIREPFWLYVWAAVSSTCVVRFPQARGCSAARRTQKLNLILCPDTAGSTLQGPANQPRFPGLLFFSIFAWCFFVGFAC